MTMHKLVGSDWPFRDLARLRPVEGMVKKLHGFESHKDQLKYNRKSSSSSFVIQAKLWCYLNYHQLIFPLIV